MLRPEVASARKQRRALTLPEVMLWGRLRGSPSGVRFRRQHPIGPYVVDYYCAAASLVIEIDGEIHALGDRPLRDGVRQAFLEQNGYRVVRVAAVRVMTNVDATAAAIVARAAALVARAACPLHQPVAGPPPRAGEDQE